MGGICGHGLSMTQTNKFILRSIFVLQQWLPECIRACVWGGLLTLDALAFALDYCLLLLRLFGGVFWCGCCTFFVFAAATIVCFVWIREFLHMLLAPVFKHWLSTAKQLCCQVQVLSLLLYLSVESIRNIVLHEFMTLKLALRLWVALLCDCCFHLTPFVPMMLPTSFAAPNCILKSQRNNCCFVVWVRRSFRLTFLFCCRLLTALYLQQLHLQFPS